VSKITEKIKTRSKPTPSENFNSHPLLKISVVRFVATSIDAPQHVRVDTRGSQTEGIKDVASLRLALSPINFNHGTTNHAVHHFVIHCYLLLSLFVIVVTLNSNHASSRLIHSGPTKYSTDLL
jgi:hypothetical protein